MPDMKAMTITVTKTCPMCGKTRDFILDAEKYYAWKGGAYVQDVFPEMSTDDREQLISGIDSECWGKYMVNKDDE